MDKKQFDKATAAKLITKVLKAETLSNADFDQLVKMGVLTAVITKKEFEDILGEAVSEVESDSESKGPGKSKEPVAETEPKETKTKPEVTEETGKAGKDSEGAGKVTKSEPAKTPEKVSPEPKQSPKRK